MNKVIDAKGICKEFIIGKSREQVLKQISFQVRQGEFLSVMGPSGCGKSTLLYILGGLDLPTGGEVYSFGRSYKDMSEKEKSKMRRTKIGFVFQFYNLVPNLNVEDNILLPILLDGKKIKDYENPLSEILEITGLTERRKFKPRELSGGQQQRVAQSAALRPGTDSG